MDTFLGTGQTGDVIKEIAEACRFKNMKKADAEVKLHEEFMIKAGRPCLYRLGIYHCCLDKLHQNLFLYFFHNAFWSSLVAFFYNKIILLVDILKFDNKQSFFFFFGFL
jgi:hypothetical protein